MSKGPKLSLADQIRVWMHEEAARFYRKRGIGHLFHAELIAKRRLMRDAASCDRITIRPSGKA